MLTALNQPNQALIHNPSQKCWLFFQNPSEILVAKTLAEVVPALEQVERALAKRHCYAAGFIAYEAAPAFDQVLRAKPTGDFPLLWFGLYDRPQIIPSPGKWTEKFNPALPDWSPTTTRSAYDVAIERIKEFIARGDTYQVNYTYRLRTPFQDDAPAFFFELFKAQKAPYAAYIDTGRFVLCSASPELFFSLEGDLITSRPMKGTAGRGLSLLEDLAQAEWLKNSEKNRAENVMIVDMVRNDIGRIAETGSIRVPELFSVEKYPTVWQMVSTVTGETRAGLLGILRALFPPASITGAPKARTMEIIAELETTPRLVYTGGIGFIGPGRQAQFNVAIRTAIIDKETGQAEYGVGGGITWDSVDAAEFDECQTKAKILSARIPSFSLLETMLWSPQEGYLLVDHHLSRLRDSAVYFDFSIDIEAVHRYLESLTAGFSRKAHKVRLIVAEDGNMETQAEPLNWQGEAGVRGGRSMQVSLAENPIESNNPFLYHKTTNRRVYEQARRERPEFDDVILWNERGEVTETTIANLVVELEGELYTPPVSCGLLPGIYRGWLLEQGEVGERVIHIHELPDCNRIWAVNSVRKRWELQLVRTAIVDQLLETLLSRA
jgi:para-aminobenzoate synthetase / 4-amino-4-deoxychorismate lyase